jgi:hypothetical protein
MSTDGQPGRTCSRITAENNAISFLSCKGRAYLSLDYHRAASGTTYTKAVWIISREDERHAFCEAEEHGWCDSSGNYWSVSKDAEVVFGGLGERVAFFPKPQNETDPVHGYPVGWFRGLPSPRKPSNDIIELWYATERISWVIYSRLMGGRI